MLNRLSAKYQKEIAMSFMWLFFISGLNSLKAEVLSGYVYRNNNTSFNYAGSSTRIKGEDNKRMLMAGNKEAVIKRSSPGIPDPGIKKLNKDKNVPAEDLITKTVNLSGSPYIGGPSQPEMTAFKSVGADNMVSPFTGDFSYNIPLLDVGGYPVNMFYSSGITMDQESSWLGLGWNINPGTVNRSMRGLPDDFNGKDIVTKRQSIKPDKTWGVVGTLGAKLAGFPITAGMDFSGGISYNNKLGVALEAGVHPSIGISAKSGDNMTAGLSFGANLNASSRNGASITPSINFSITHEGAQSGKTNASLGASYTYSSRRGVESMHIDAGVTNSLAQMAVVQMPIPTTFSTNISFAYPTIVPSIKNIFTRRNFNLSFSTGGEIYYVNIHGRISGFYSESKIADRDKETKHAAYGMLYYQNANNDDKAMLDFNRSNEGIYTPKTPAIAMPIYTYDVFNISGEGTGGAFRATRADLGFMRDGFVRTCDDAISGGLDLGYGNSLHGGAELSMVYTPSEAGTWSVNNFASSVFKFQESDKTYQSVYFKNPAEKTIPDANFQNTIGGENLVRLKLSNIKSGSPSLLPNLLKYDAGKNYIGEAPLNANSVKKSTRDKRTQVISFLTAEEADRIGFNRKIYSYNTDNTDTNKVIFGNVCNKAGIDSFLRYDNGLRKNHHISEIDVLGTDGKKYVYGIPVYTTRQVNVSFSVENGSNATGKSSYVPGIDDERYNTKGRDWYMNQEEIPGYAQSYLLTELVSPNYVDVKGDGITDDDMGDAIKFNYTKFTNGYKWRTPNEANTATYSEGLKTDHKDDKAHYIYGEREMWYLYTIESKNMIARFYVKNDRKDCKQVVGQSGGIDNNWGMQRLDKICLFSKADLIKENNGGPVAKPIKTVKFFQTYKLCPGTPNSENNTGKLTLDSIQISYNGKQKKAKSKYVFYYPSDAEKNPVYDYNGNDSWGNYKPTNTAINENPGGLGNADYPYAIQDKTKADKYAAAWTMNKIVLPSGGVINVDYESDDYAYVQNKKAASMYQVIGFGDKANPSTNAERTNPNLYSASKEYEFVYVQIPYAITSTNLTEQQQELKARYFENATQIYMKLAVIMPSTPGLAGTEMIPVYADINSYGMVPNTNGTIAYVKVNRLNNGVTPMVQLALQFIKQQIPGKAYKGYDVSENAGGRAIVLALAGMATSIDALLNGDDNVLKKNGKCKQVETAKSFVRLINPSFAKKGGGMRVKRITIKDNFDKMKGIYAATYGQEYKYTTTELINNKLMTISSGVAAWEPAIGNDENLNRDILRFMDHNKGGPYDYGAVEMPMGEMFYPSPLVGYSRVEVLSIHRDTVKNLPTRQVTEFFTTKDFPFRSSYTQLHDPEANVKYEPSAIKRLLKIDMKKSITQSQGFLVDMNDMNGREKLQATYSALDSVNPVSYTRNYYNVTEATDKTYKFNHNFPTINSPNGTIVNNSLIGRDIELMTDFREHKTETITSNYSINFDMAIFGYFPIPIFNLLTPPIKEKTTYRSAAVLKIVNHYGMIDSVVSITKGSMVSTKNLVYDAETGNPLLTRTNNEHKKPIYNFSYPAYWAYSGMGPAYKNIDAVYSGLTFRHGILENPPAGINNILESGDEIYVLAPNNDSLIAIYPCDNNAGAGDAWNTLQKNYAKKIWAVSTAKAGASNPQMVFMDEHGNPYNAVNANIRIVRSGHRNMLDQSVGNITSLSDPRVNNQLVFNDATNIVQTTAATFKDNWRVDNQFYRLDSTVNASTYGRIKKLSLPPLDHLNVYGQKYSANPVTYSSSKNDFISLWKWSKAPSGSHHSESQYQRGFVLYDYNQVPSNARLFKAYLSLYSHTTVNRGLPSNVSVYHSYYLHGPASSQHVNLFGEVNALKSNWYATNAANSWGNTYLNWGPDSYVSSLSPIFAATVGNEDYSLITNGNNYIEKRILVTNQVNEVSNSVLAQTKKIGFRYKLIADNNTNGAPGQYRCFWTEPGCSQSFGFNNGDSTNAWYPNACDLVKPNLSYYYYVCGDTLSTSNSNNDPYINKFVRCDSATILGTFCVSKFNRKAINPYVEGVLGNWRVDSIYAYYGERKETDPAVTVDTRVGGTIINYKKFWNFNSAYLERNYTANDVWVWNSTITQYNRKGYEIENKDALGRFNAGLYGYNQQLPIAVANNARVREVMFDGFEDYDYQTASNCIDCAPSRSIKYNSNVVTKLDATQKHTGRYSLKLASGQSIVLNAPVTNDTEADKAYSIKIQPGTNTYINTGLGSGGISGSGLKASYYNHPYNYPSVQVLEPGVNSNFVYSNPATSIGIPYSNNASPAANVNPDYFSVKWEGIIQIPATGFYKFYGYSDNCFRIKVNGVQLSSNNSWTDAANIHSETTAGIQLQVGQTYSIEVCFYDLWGAHQFSLQWKKDNGALSNIPITALYPPGSTTFRDVTTSTLTCNRLDSVQVTGNALTDTFSLLQSKKMILSAWVKENTTDCKCSTYVKNSITINYSGSSQTETFVPAGSIIEGWQRYESVFTVPANATAINVSLNNTQGSGYNVFFDDVRILPFNSNVKSFVYHSSNLRLMAELDENNYASFYEYDDDGTLTRVKKETIHGIKTITETRSAMQKSIKE